MERTLRQPGSASRVWSRGAGPSPARGAPAQGTGRPGDGHSRRRLADRSGQRGAPRSPPPAGSGPARGRARPDRGVARSGGGAPRRGESGPDGGPPEIRPRPGPARSSRESRCRGRRPARRRTPAPAWFATRTGRDRKGRLEERPEFLEWDRHVHGPQLAKPGERRSLPRLVDGTTSRAKVLARPSTSAPTGPGSGRSSSPRSRLGPPGGARRAHPGHEPTPARGRLRPRRGEAWPVRAAVPAGRAALATRGALPRSRPDA